MKIIKRAFLFYANGFDSVLVKIGKDGKNETELDKNSFPADLIIGKKQDLSERRDEDLRTRKVRKRAFESNFRDS